MIGLIIGGLAVGGVASPILIGIAKIVEHPALDAVERGIIDGLEEAGYRRGVDVDYLLASAQGDMSIAVGIAQNFLAQRVDIVVAITTSMALAAVQVLGGTDIPVVYSAVTAPLAYGIIVSEDDPKQNGNVTGVSDLIDVENDLQLLRDLGDGIRKIGLIYNAGEANAEVLKEAALAAAPSVGVEVVTAVASSPGEVQMAAQSLIGRVDAYFVTTDNTVVSAIDSVVAAAEEGGVPFLVADPTSLPLGPVIAAGFDYYTHGRVTSTVIERIIKGESPEDIAPITHSQIEPEEVWLNLDAAAKIGLVFPQKLIDLADGIYYSGVIWERKEE